MKIDDSSTDIIDVISSSSDEEEDVLLFIDRMLDLYSNNTIMIVTWIPHIIPNKQPIKPTRPSPYRVYSRQNSRKIQRTRI